VKGRKKKEESEREGRTGGKGVDPGGWSGKKGLRFSAHGPQEETRHEKRKNLRKKKKKRPEGS